jgi:GNAT superfamily N-acetyltransferase
MGQIAARQSMLYRATYGWGPGIEVNIGEVTAAFLRDFKPGRERCWVADIDGVMAGSIFLTDDGGGLSRLRLLYVEPFARGLGLGDRLVAACIEFAREVGYDAIWLWTHTILESARRIYAGHGFRITDVHVHEEFGEPIQGENWRLDLRDLH